MTIVTGMLRPDVGASDRGLGTSGRSQQVARCSAAVVLVIALAATACTRPEDAASSDVTIAPVTDTTDAGQSDASVADDEPTDVTSELTTATTSTTSTSSTIAGGAATSTTVDAEPTGRTEPTATTAAAPPDEPSDLTLVFDGLLPFRFGDRDVDVVPELTELLGAPTRDELREYPTADQGLFLDATGEESFVARFGRTVCYAGGLCVQFGAGAPETLIFTGWRVDDASSELTTDDGLTIGSTLDEFSDLITFDPALACGQEVDGSAAGIDVTLLSDDGGFAEPPPDPASVTVIAMRAGRLPTPVGTDC